ncbi:MAG: MFS transporter [Chloroflexota bacterium]
MTALPGPVTPAAPGVQERRFHYAWVVVAVTFVAMLVAAGIRAAPATFIVPFETAFGWDRASVSLVVAISILAYGLGAPLGGTLMDRVGPRWTMSGGLVLVGAGLLGMLGMTQLWQFLLLWGGVVGIGTGMLSSVLAATVAQRWFRTNRGVVMGLLSSAGSAGQLVFLPSLVAITLASGWTGAVSTMAIAAGVLVPVAVLLMRDRPEDVGRRPVGDDGTLPPERNEDGSAATTIVPLRAAARSWDFWLLAGSFFVCGFTSNGLIGTHLLPHAIEHGFAETTAASALALMGAMNAVGTLASGWLTDRYDNRRLLAIFYALRASSIFLLPFVAEASGLYAFAVVMGLDWIATVPPTANLVSRIWGRANVGKLYGWIFFSHMVGAALAAWAGGVVREVFGDYTAIFLAAGLLGLVAAAMALRISHPGLARRPDAGLSPAAPPG